MFSTTVRERARGLRARKSGGRKSGWRAGFSWLVLWFAKRLGR